MVVEAADAVADADSKIGVDEDVDGCIAADAVVEDVEDIAGDEIDVRKFELFVAASVEGAFSDDAFDERVEDAVEDCSDAVVVDGNDE